MEKVIQGSAEPTTDLSAFDKKQTVVVLPYDFDIANAKIVMKTMNKDDYKKKAFAALSNNNVQAYDASVRKSLKLVSNGQNINLEAKKAQGELLQRMKIAYRNYVTSYAYKHLRNIKITCIEDLTNLFSCLRNFASFQGTRHENFRPLYDIHKGLSKLVKYFYTLEDWGILPEDVGTAATRIFLADVATLIDNSQALKKAQEELSKLGKDADEIVVDEAKAKLKAARAKLAANLKSFNRNAELSA